MISSSPIGPRACSFCVLIPISAPHPRPLPQAVPNSFAEWMNATDYEFVITHPEGYELDPQFVGNAKVEYDQMKAFEGADFIYAKNWAAYSGDNYGQILSKDRDWTVSDRQMAVTNNAYFMMRTVMENTIIGVLTFLFLWRNI